MLTGGGEDRHVDEQVFPNHERRRQAEGLTTTKQVTQHAVRQGEYYQAHP